MEENNPPQNNVDKANILGSISRIPANQLYKYITQNVVTFIELQATGRFDATKQAEVRKLQAADDEKNKEENDAWQIAVDLNTSNSYQVYINLYPEGRFAGKARENIQQLRIAELAQSQDVIDEIINNRLSYTRDHIVQKIEAGKVRTDDLLKHGVLPEEVLQHIRVEPNLTEHIHGWSELPALEEDRTDLYFFGIPASGKSCLLAGLLKYADLQGRISIEVNNSIGFKYAQDLMNAVKMGCTPPSTPVEGVNYITVDFFDDANTPHPLNIIEMSGEYFDNTYRNSSVQGEKSIGASDYLSNNNKKIIFLVVDYHTGSGSVHMTSNRNQAGKLSMALKLLEKDGTLGRADGVFLILTKSDQLAGGATDLESATAFINSNFNSLRHDLRRMKEKYNFETRIFPFSLGTFYLRDTFKYDPETSQVIFDEIISSSFYKKKKRRWL